MADRCATRTSALLMILAGIACTSFRFAPAHAFSSPTQHTRRCGPLHSRRHHGFHRLPVSLGGTSVTVAATTASKSVTSLPPPSTYVPLLALLPAFILLRPLNLTRPLFIASLRTLLQLSVLGGVVLSLLFQHSTPTVVLPYLAALAMVAAGEASSRVKYAYPNLRLHALISLMVGCGSTLSLAALSSVGGVDAKGFDARTLVPLGGMLLGNAVTAVALVADALVTSLSEETDRIELYLSGGATVREACLPTVKSAVATALAPTINSLSVCGLVHIPGVMAGQILAGADPSSAGRSQAAVMMLLAGGSATSALLMVALVLRRAFDWDWQRICADWGEAVESAKKGAGASGAGWAWLRENARGAIGRIVWKRKGLADNDEVAPSTPGSLSCRHVTARPLSNGQEDVRSSDQRPSVLCATSVPIPRTNYTVTFDLRQGDRLGITGRSGAGKTTLLRALSLLEGGQSGNLTLLEEAAPGKHGAPDWRRRVCWVPQHRPTLPGTPGQFYENLERFDSRQHRSRHVQELNESSLVCHPSNIASKWGLDPSSFHRSWSSLSGGEAARASLASAIALHPDVLLLDEPTAGCDSETERKVEDTLRESGSTMVIVTHSRSQLGRFCTHHVDLD